MTCAKCDIRRERNGQTQQIGKECDICAGTRFTYLDSPCRHCHPANPLYKEKQ